MPAKSHNAFRTISEVAAWLDVPTHVLRFWESKFSQIKPVKRAGGRRYYRPEDMLLIGGIKTLLHDEGITIRGVQKRLKEDGIAQISALSQALDDTQPNDEAAHDTPSANTQIVGSASNVAEETDPELPSLEQRSAEENTAPSPDPNPLQAIDPTFVVDEEIEPDRDAIDPILDASSPEPEPTAFASDSSGGPMTRRARRRAELESMARDVPDIPHKPAEPFAISSDHDDDIEVDTPSDIDEPAEAPSSLDVFAEPADAEHDVPDDRDDTPVSEDAGSEEAAASDASMDNETEDNLEPLASPEPEEEPEAETEENTETAIEETTDSDVAGDETASEDIAGMGEQPSDNLSTEQDAAQETDAQDDAAGEVQDLDEAAPEATNVTQLPLSDPAPGVETAPADTVEITEQAETSTAPEEEPQTIEEHVETSEQQAEDVVADAQMSAPETDVASEPMVQSPVSPDEAGVAEAQPENTDPGTPLEHDTEEELASSGSAPDATPPAPVQPNEAPQDAREDRIVIEEGVTLKEPIAPEPDISIISIPDSRLASLKALSRLRSCDAVELAKTPDLVEIEAHVRKLREEMAAALRRASGA